MRLFVVEITDGGADGEYMTCDQLQTLMQRDWEGVPTVRALDRAVFAAIEIAHVGQVITWRKGWVFCAENDKT